MFNRIRKAFFGSSQDASSPRPGRAGLAEHEPMSQWAATQGFAFAADGTGQGLALEGKVGTKPWRLQLGHSTRQYIVGQELRARAELGISEDVSVLVMNRPLKDALEKQAYEIYTDHLQTSLDPSLPEEMRWLAMFDEVGWETLPQAFWDRYAVLSDNREHATTWVDAVLAGRLLDWPAPAPAPQVPFMIMLLRGKAYLRMEYSPADPLLMQHAALIFTSACESALDGFS